MADIKGYPNNRDEFVGCESLMKWLHGRTSGVFAADSSASVTAVQNKMAVNLSDGYGWITDAEQNGIVWWVDSQKTTGTKLEIGIDPADSVLSRIDRVIVEWTTTNYTEYPVVKVLKGANSTNPQPPVLTNTSTKRQISLARVRIPAGTTAITPGLITDERLDSSVCGLVTYGIEIDTSVIQDQLSDLLTAYEDALAEASGGTAYELKRLQFENVTVQPAAFVQDETYVDYPYRATIALSGVLSNMTPQVTFGVDDAISGNYAPVAEAYTGGVYIYAGSIPEAAITIPTIECRKAVE